MLNVLIGLYVVGALLFLLDKRAERQRQRESKFLSEQRAIDNYFKAWEEW